MLEKLRAHGSTGVTPVYCGHFVTTNAAGKYVLNIVRLSSMSSTRHSHHTPMLTLIQQVFEKFGCSLARLLPFREATHLRWVRTVAHQVLKGTVTGETCRKLQSHESCWCVT